MGRVRCICGTPDAILLIMSIGATKISLTLSLSKGEAGCLIALS
jgi:hypothetical protein